MNEKETKTILEIADKYGFEYLDEDFDKNELKLEYYKNDIEYLEEEDFDNRLDYEIFCDLQGKIICKNFDKIKKEIENRNNIKITVNYIEWDEYDYPCIYIGIL